MFRNITSVVAILLTILAALNVYGDFSDVEAQARALAASTGGEAHLSQVSRNPIAHTYVFAVKGQTTVSVSCSRAVILLGDYSCKVED